MRYAILAIVFLLAPTLARADELPDAPVAKPDAVRVEVARRPSALNHRVFVAGVSALALAETADILETRRLIDRGGVELNPIFGRHPSTARQVGLNAIFFVGQTTVFYFTEKSRRPAVRWAGRIWITGMIVNHARMAACNSSINPTGSERCSPFPGPW